MAWSPILQTKKKEWTPVLSVSNNAPPKVKGLLEEARIAQEEARKANSFGGLLKSTLKQTGSTLNKYTAKPALSALVVRPAVRFGQAIGTPIAKALGATPEDLSRAQNAPVTVNTGLLGKIDVKPATSQRQVAGEGLEAASYLYTPAKAVRTVAPFLKGVSVPARQAISNIARGALGGYAVDVGYGLQDETKTTKEALKPGLGTVLGAGIPAAVAGGQALKEGRKLYQSMTPAQRQAGFAKFVPDEKGFYINEYNAKGKPAFVPAEKAKAVDISPAIETFVSKGKISGWRISEGKTGTLIAEGTTQKEAIEKASEILEKNKNNIETAITKATERGGVSPRYAKASITSKTPLLAKENQTVKSHSEARPRMDRPPMTYERYQKSISNIEQADPLAQEARKYKTAEEFVKAQEAKPIERIKTSLDTARKELGNYKNQRGQMGAKLTAKRAKELADATESHIKIFERDLAESQELTDLWERASGKTGPLLGRKLSPLELPKATTETIQTLPKKAPQILEDGIQGNLPPNRPVSPTLETSIPPEGDAVNKIIQAIKESKPLLPKQAKLYSEERAARVARVASVGERVPGEQGYFKQLGQLKGELPKVNFGSVRSKITQADVDSLFNKIEQTKIFSPFEKVSAKGGLAKLLGAEGGGIPNRGELKLLSEVFPPEFMEAILSKRSRGEKIWELTKNLVNLPRAIMATADFSAPLRQGVFMVGRPKQWIPAFKDMFKYAFSEKAYQGLLDNIQARPTYRLMRESKLALTDMSKFNLETREEQFMSNIADKIPGFGILSRGSNRAYSGFLNKLRADVFDDLVKKAKNLNILEERPDALRDIAKFINSATGRGDLGGLNKVAPVLNGIFFSPRLLASRLNLLNPVFYAKLDPFARKEALKSLLSFGAIATSVLGLFKLGGAKVEDDSRSADFGKIKIGNTRYDILGGFQQYIRLASQLITGKIISSTTGKEITLGEGYKPLTRKGVLFRFVESKESPVLSFATALATGQTNLGEPLNVPVEVINRFIPLVTQDMYDLYKERGLEGIGMSLPGLFGTGSMTYGKQELVTGKNQLGQETSQVRPVGGLSEDISAKIFGEPLLKSSKSFSVEAYYNQMLKLPKEEAAKQFDEIKQTNPDLAKKILGIVKDRELGITVADKSLKEKGVANGDRAMAIAGQLQKLKAKEEKATLWEEYVKKKIITDEVAKQLIELLK